ncbi:MAG TPA: ATP phosphoribosyltransferase, partial [Nitriliruptoraceae bacterium]|nr:ATP phosphoribosyltransferase [Nitriliruptoraceae bacterium]
AVPHKGTLSEAAIAMLREAGYRQRRDRRDLALIDPSLDVEFFYLRPKDIATYVGTGQLDAGITGRDLLVDSGTSARELVALGFGRSNFRFAAVPGAVGSEAELAGRRIATSYPGLVASRLDELGIEAEIINLDGAVETAVRLGVADVVADVVSTGTTLRQAGLELVGDPVLESEAVLITGTDTASSPGLEQLVRRLEGLTIARQWVMMDYDVRVDQVDRACALTPGIESPTVSPLHDKEWVAVRSMVQRDRTNSIMDDLHDLGAKGILVTEILACRL